MQPSSVREFCPLPVFPMPGTDAQCTYFVFNSRMHYRYRDNITKSSLDSNQVIPTNIIGRTMLQHSIAGGYDRDGRQQRLRFFCTPVEVNLSLLCPRQEITAAIYHTALLQTYSFGTETWRNRGILSLKPFHCIPQGSVQGPSSKTRINSAPSSKIGSRNECHGKRRALSIRYQHDYDLWQ